MADWTLEGVSAVLLIAIFALVALAWPDLPDRVPRHFNASGQPDAWGGRSFVWFLPAVAVFLWLLMTVAGRYPQLVNIPMSVDRDDPAVRQVLLSMTIALKAVILISFAYITSSSIGTAMGRTAGLGSTFLPLFLLSTIGIVGFYLWRLRGLRRS